MSLKEESCETEKLLKLRQLIKNGNVDQAVDYFHDSLIGYECFLNFSILNIDSKLTTEFLSEYATKFRSGDRQDFYDTIFEINLRESKFDGRDLFYCCDDETVKINYANRSITECSFGEQVMDNVIEYISGLNKEQIETFLPVIEMNPELFFDRESDKAYLKDFEPITYAILNNEDSVIYALRILLERLNYNYNHHADNYTYEYNVLSYITDKAQAYEKVILEYAEDFINVFKEKEKYDGADFDYNNSIMKVIIENKDLLLKNDKINMQELAFLERIQLTENVRGF